MNHITVAVDVFADSDLERPCAAVRRVGGGMYRVLLPGEAERNVFDDFETALAFAEEIASLVEADPTLHSPHAVHANALLAQEREASRAKDARIAELEAALATKE